MKNNRKVTFKKDEIVDVKMKKAGKAWSIGFIGLGIVIAVVMIFLYFIPSHSHLHLNEMYLIISLSIILFYGFICIMYMVGKEEKKKGPRHFIVKQNEEKYKIVETLSNNNEELVGEFDEAIQSQTEAIAFKEEQIEKQDDSNVNIVKSFPEFSHFINDYFLQKGFKTDVGFELVASIATSPILFINDGEHNDVFIENINGCFNSPSLLLDASRSESISNDYALFDAINTARSFKNSPVFLVIKNLEAEKADAYLLPLKKFFMNRNNATIQLSNNVVTIPSNLYVIVSLKEDNTLSLVNPELLRFATLFSFNCEQDSSIEEPNPRPIELGEFNIVYALNRLKNDVFLDEEYWKKVDAIEEAFVNVGHPRFDNKMLSHLESYISIIINATNDQLSSLDYALANLVLLPCLTQCGVDVFKDENDIRAIFDSLFDEDEMPKSRQVIKDFFLSNEKEGN